MAKVTPKLNDNPDIKEWSVDTANPAKILTVKTDNLVADDVKGIVASAGFKAEAID